jgi:TM2 domain-containing membrane protein YozV
MSVRAIEGEHVSGYQQGPSEDGRSWQDPHAQQPWPPAPPPPNAGMAPYQQSQPYPPQNRIVVVPVKTPGLAVLFSFLWLGAGNCYAGQVGLGVTLIIAQVVCAPLSAILASVTLGFSLLITVPIWIVAFVVSAVTGYSACTEHNRSLGFPRY